jgi:hypothetical protein
MLRADEFVTVHAQACIYTTGQNFNAGPVLGRLLNDFPRDFTGDPLTLPIPADFPSKDVPPRLTLPSRDGKFVLLAAPSRLDIIQKHDNDLEAVRLLPEFFDLCLRMIDSYLGVTQEQVVRMGSVLGRKSSPPHPALAIAEQFCKPEMLAGPLNRPSDFEIHAAKQFDFLEGLRINSWFRCKSALLPGKQPLAVVVVEQDFNTRVEEMQTRVFGPDDRRQFFGHVPDGFREVLNLYFPQRN